MIRLTKINNELFLSDLKLFLLKNILSAINHWYNYSMQACFLNDASSQSKSDKISHLFPSTLSIFIFPLFSFILILCLWSYNLLPIFVNMYFEENVDAWLRYIIYTVAFIRLSSEFNRNQYIKKIFFYVAVHICTTIALK